MPSGGLRSSAVRPKQSTFGGFAFLRPFSVGGFLRGFFAGGLVALFFSRGSPSAGTAHAGNQHLGGVGHVGNTFDLGQVLHLKVLAQFQFRYVQLDGGRQLARAATNFNFVCVHVQDTPGVLNSYCVTDQN